MADSIYNWSTTAGDNDAADSIINWRENQLSNTVNDSARAMMKRIAEWRDDMTGSMVTEGLEPSYLLTTSAVFETLDNGRLIVCRIHATNTGPATLNVNGLGAKSIRKFGITGDLPVAAGDLQAGGLYQFVYSTEANGGAGAWVTSNPSTGPSGLAFPAGTAMLFMQPTAPAGWTKVTTHDNKALRIVSGSTGGSGGGTKTFTECFTSRTIGGTTSAVALTLAQLPSHTHTQAGTFQSGGENVDHSHGQQGGFNSGDRSVGHVHGYLGPQGAAWGIDDSGGHMGQRNTDGENTGHYHATYISGQTGGRNAGHVHSTTISGQTGAQGAGAEHSHDATSTADFAVAYVDAIICTKD